SCASLLRSIGVARNDGECTQVHASEEMTSRPYRCPAEEAQRSCVNSVHPQPSPSIRSADRLELIEIGGSPYPCRRNGTPCSRAQSEQTATKLSSDRKSVVEGTGVARA